MPMKKLINIKTRQLLLDKKFLTIFKIVIKHIMLTIR